MWRRNVKWAVVSVLIVVFDQLTKYLVMENLTKTESISVIPKLFNFVYVENTGAAFSILSGKTLGLGIVSVIFCIGVIIYWFLKKEKTFMPEIALVFLFSGALGNAIDRIFRGFVVDFIQTDFIAFPVFNVADIAVTFGTVILLIYLLFFDKEQINGENNPSGI